MADKTLAYDHPAYLVPHVFAGNTTVGANGISQKFAAFTAMQIKAVHSSPNIASTAAGSQPLMYTVSGTTTATTTLTVLTSASRDTRTDALATAVSLARGDQVYLTHGTDATAVMSFAVECAMTPGAALTA
jgi:hypothetical protein